MDISKPAEQIFKTLKEFDPEKMSLCVGGAAMAVHLAESGVKIPPQADVDVLCSQNFFDDCYNNAKHWPQVDKINVRSPHGDEAIRALSPIVDIYPKRNTPLLSFSACVAMGGTWYPTYYDEAITDVANIVHYQGYPFMSMAKLLMWTAVAGREKDIPKVDKLLPLAHEKDLISDDELTAIVLQRNLSAALRNQHPLRHYARVPKDSSEESR